MKDKNILLSFCIPTYKRKNIVKECIEEIQKIRSEKIEIVVVDNYSNDGTKEMILEMSLLDNRIKYKENKENIGFIANVTTVLKEANGKYLFLISDEDLINVEFIENLLNSEILEKGNYNALFGNVLFLLENGKSRYEIFYRKDLIKLKDEEMIKYFIGRRHFSGVIYRKNNINFELLEKYKNNSNNMYPQVLPLFTMLGKGKIRIFSTVTCTARSLTKANSLSAQKDEKNNTIPYFSPIGRIKQLEFMLEFIEENIKELRIKKAFYKEYGKYYSQLYAGSLFEKEDFLGYDFRQEKNYFYMKIQNYKEIKKYFKVYLIYYEIKKIIKNIVKSIVPNKILQYLKGEK